jgi:hypothetical protein
MERAILTILKGCHPYLMSVATLWSEVLLDVPRAGYTGFRAAVGELEMKGQIVVVKGEDREKIKITDAGLARLLES